MTYVIIFGSLIHGAGRSFLKKHLEDILRSKGYKVKSLSTGDLLREIATTQEKSISELVEEMTKNEDYGYAMDIQLDSKFKEEIENLCQTENYDFILVDSNVAPYYPLNCKNVIRILVDTSAEVAAKRVFNRPRKGDKIYNSLDEVKSDILRRTELDKERYRRWADKIKKENKTNLLWLAEAYIRYANDDKSTYDIIFDNNEDISKSLPKLIEVLKRYIPDLL